MALKDDIKDLNKIRKDLQSNMEYNYTLFDINEGNLLHYVLQDLKAQLSEKTFESTKHRIPPINVLKKVVDKQSKIYVEPPKRDIVNGSEEEKVSLGELTDMMALNQGMQSANEIFNLAKSVAVEPFLDKGKPSLRVLPPDQFFVVSTDKVNPLNPTHFVKLMGKMKINDKEREIFHAYTDDEFLIYDDQNEIRMDLMAKYENEGVNHYKKIPFVYINRSKYTLIPTRDTDTLAMTKLIPVLLSDCNYASMYQSFSIIYGIDVDDSNLVMSPNAFWSFKSQGDDAAKTPQVGTIKPEADTDKILNLVKTQLAMWLDSKNIKPGSVGDMTVDNAASGIAKMIDEADTSGDREVQANIFAPAEERLLSLIVNHMIPVWRDESDFKFEKNFGPNREFNVDFPEQTPIPDTTKILDDEIKKLSKKLTTRKRAIQAINPKMSEKEIEMLISEIDNDQPPTPPAAPALPIPEEEEAA